MLKQLLIDILAIQWVLLKHSGTTSPFKNIQIFYIAQNENEFGTTALGT